MITVARGADAALVWTVAGTLTAPAVTITPIGSLTPTLGPTDTGLVDTGAGRYTYVWSPSTSLDPGRYTATLTGTIGAAAVIASLTVVVTGLPTYTTLDLLRADLRIPAADTTRDARLTGLIAAASRVIDDHCDRRFWADAAATARVFRTRDRVVDDDDGQLLLVDDIADDTGLVVEAANATTWTTLVDSVDTVPDNALTRYRPVTGLRLDTACWSTWRRIRVTAVWGWPAVPEPVSRACLVMAARMHRDIPDSVAATTASEWPRGVKLVDPGTEAILAPYRA